MNKMSNGKHGKNGRPGARPCADRPVLITGGAGFIGTNLAHRLVEEGHSVLVFDNLSRAGVERNLAWLRSRHGERVQFRQGDVRDRQALGEVVGRASQVFHLAAQVAVTTSLADPVLDFEVNIGGTLNLLEELRALRHPPPLVFTSTNKVYGALPNLRLRRDSTRYKLEGQSALAGGVNEDCPRDFHSPYGCSKGAADQYVLDYARSFGLQTVVFRMSCIYGPHQLGTEDQGWVAHFLLCALEDRPLTLYGDGLQVRDVLFVEDLAEAFLLAQAHMKTLSGQAFNMGGGPDNTVSLLELLELIGELHGQVPVVRTSAWRTGDQRYYVSDTSRFRAATGWAPRVDVRAGVGHLYEWLLESRRPSARRLLAGKEVR
jgi:CDP-paratose 2-epimerase